MLPAATPQAVGTHLNHNCIGVSFNDPFGRPIRVAMWLAVNGSDNSVSCRTRHDVCRHLAGQTCLLMVKAHFGIRQFHVIVDLSTADTSCQAVDDFSVERAT